MKKLSLDLDLEKLILVSSLGVSCLLIGSSISSDGCSLQSPVWNQQLQSTKSFGSLAIDQPAANSKVSIPTFNTPFTTYQCR
jgi:hypothetical protein